MGKGRLGWGENERGKGEGVFETRWFGDLRTESCVSGGKRAEGSAEEGAYDEQGAVRNDSTGAAKEGSTTEWKRLTFVRVAQREVRDRAVRDAQREASVGAATCAERRQRAVKQQRREKRVE